MAKKVYEEENIRVIANKIREKTGNNKTYKVKEMPSGIEAVYEAGKLQGTGNGGYNEGFEAGQQAEHDMFWDNYQDHGKRTNYRYAFYGQGWTLETFKPKHDLIVTGSGEFMFSNSRIKCDLVELLKDLGITLDLSKATVISQCLRNTYFTRFGELNFSKMKSLNYVLDLNSYLETIDKLIISDDGTTTFVSTFAANKELKNITFEGVIGQDIDFKDCSKLTHDSLMSIINALKSLKEIVETVYEFNENLIFLGASANITYNQWYKITSVLNNTVGKHALELEGVFNDYGNGHISAAPIIKDETTEPFNENSKEFIVYGKNDDGTYHYGLKVLEEKTSTETRTLTLGETNLAKLTDEEKAIATNKGWILA